MMVRPGQGRMVFDLVLWVVTHGCSGSAPLGPPGQLSQVVANRNGFSTISRCRSTTSKQNASYSPGGNTVMRKACFNLSDMTRNQLINTQGGGEDRKGTSLGRYGGASTTAIQVRPRSVPGATSDGLAADATGRDGDTDFVVRIALRPHQEEVFRDRSSGILILHWARQIGKSFCLAAWAVDRLLTRPGRLVTVLSNSRENGAEFVAKCAEVCRLNGTEYESVDQSQGVRFQNMRMEVRIHAQG